MNKIYTKTKENEHLFGRCTSCCTIKITDCPKYKTDGYNCYGINHNGMIAPWGLKDEEEFKVLYDKKKFGSCKCLTHEIDYDCPCGIMNVSNNDINYNHFVYLSCFKTIIQKRASHGSIIDIKALEFGREVLYNFYNN